MGKTERKSMSWKLNSLCCAFSSWNLASTTLFLWTRWGSGQLRAIFSSLLSCSPLHDKQRFTAWSGVVLLQYAFLCWFLIEALVQVRHQFKVEFLRLCKSYYSTPHLRNIFSLRWTLFANIERIFSKHVYIKFFLPISVSIRGVL